VGADVRKNSKRRIQRGRIQRGRIQREFKEDENSKRRIQRRRGSFPIMPQCEKPGTLAKPGKTSMTVHHEDMVTSVRFYLREEGRESRTSPICLSQAVATWFHERPELSLTTAYGIERDGNTVEIHAFYSRAHRSPYPLMTRTTFVYEPSGKLRFTTNDADQAYYRYEK
jgi:hypothetical protein